MPKNITNNFFLKIFYIDCFDISRSTSFKYNLQIYENSPINLLNYNKMLDSFF